MRSLLFVNKSFRNGSVTQLRSCALYAIIICAALLFISCGKKGPPTLSYRVEPVVPTLLHAIHREDKIILTWRFPEVKEADIRGFHVYRRTGSDAQQIAFVASDIRRLTDTDFRVGISYRYYMTTETEDGRASRDSEPLSVTPMTVPQPPVNISFKINRNSLDLNWEHADTDIRYNVYKTFEKGVYDIHPVNKKPLSVNSFNDSLSIDTAVFYTIRSLRDSVIRDEGYPSKEVEITLDAMVPSAPQRLRYFSSEDTILLYWEESPEPWVQGYRIYRRLEEQDYSFIGETGTPTFRDSELLLLPRDYRVRAVGPVEEGDASELKDVRFIPPP